MSENIWFPCGSRAKARLHSVDSRGRSIDPEVLDVAQSIAPRVIAYAEELIGDPALATSLLEESAAIVSRSLRRGTQHGKPPVANVEGYLFRSFIRRINVTRRKQLLISRAVIAAQTGSPNGTVYLENFELKILADEFVTRCDPVTRDMFYRRIEGFSWNEIGEWYGISGHAAEKRFSKILNKIRKLLGLK
jgi:DNA-directed RNA polymerase specialized sigma24 family protein